MKKKNGAGNYRAFAESPAREPMWTSCTIRVIASVNGREVARSGDIRLTGVTPRAVQLVGSYIVNHIYTGEPRIMDGEDDLRYIVSSYRNGNTKERASCAWPVNGKELPGIHQCAQADQNTTTRSASRCTTGKRGLSKGLQADGKNRGRSRSHWRSAFDFTLGQKGIQEGN